MGEIKSTLDLVLEKTRHLTLSEEEKQSQQHGEALKSLKGLLQRYRDGQLPLERLQEEFNRLTAAPAALDTRLVIEHVLSRVEIDTDNTAWLAYLETVASDALIRIRQVLSGYAEALSNASQQRERQILHELGEQQHISGSAVIPNLPADPSWKKQQAAIRGKYERLLQQAKDGFLSSSGV